jgi:ferredoxin-NADP reductase
LLLLGGGSGIVPLMCMIRHRVAQHSVVPILLLYSVRTRQEAIFREELIELQQRNDGFQLVFAVTREPAQRQGDYSRRVDAAMRAEIVARLPGEPRQVFICGSHPFVEAAAQGLIHAAVPAAIIRTEIYGG